MDEATALVVEDDEIQRSVAAVLLEDENIHVIQCDSAEAATAVLERVGKDLCMVFTDVNLSGEMTGAELAAVANDRFPGIKIIVTSGKEKPRLPPGATFLSKPWRSHELLHEALKACPHRPDHF